MGKIVVLVEDDECTRVLHAHLLRKAGHRVIERKDATDLVGLVAAERPSVVLLDISLPGEDGISACRRLKANPGTADIRVVMLTAHDSFDTVHKTMEAGAERHLVKPIQPERLYACVASEIIRRPTLLRRVMRSIGL